MCVHIYIMYTCVVYTCMCACMDGWMDGWMDVGILCRVCVYIYMYINSCACVPCTRK